MRKIPFQGGATGRDIVILVIAGHTLLPWGGERARRRGRGRGGAQAQSSLDRLQQLPHGIAVGWDLDLASLVAFKIDYGESLSGFVEDVLGDV